MKNCPEDNIGWKVIFILMHFPTKMSKISVYIPISEWKLIFDKNIQTIRWIKAAYTIRFQLEGY